MDAAEAEVLKGLFRGRSAELENTVFALLGPDGKTRLSRASRSPGMSFGSAEAMLERMVEIVDDHAADVKRKASRAKALPPLPTYKSFPIALNVASADARPLVVAVVEKEEGREEALERLRAVAWDHDFIGRYHYAVVTDRADLDRLAGAAQGDGFLLVEPGAFGLEGKVVADLDLESTAGALQRFFAKGLEGFEPVTKDPRAHVRDGRRAGKDWETEVPVSDGPEARRNK